jgi:hypothetical protein
MNDFERPQQTHFETLKKFAINHAPNFRNKAGVIGVSAVALGSSSAMAFEHPTTPELGNSEIQNCQGLEQRAFLSKEVNSYKLGSRAVSATLSLKDIAFYNLPKKEFIYDCGELTLNTVKVQLVTKSFGKGRIVAKPLGKARTVGFLTDNAHHYGSYDKPATKNKKVKLSLPTAVTPSRVNARSIGIETVVISKPKTNVSKTQYLDGKCTTMPKGTDGTCDTYPENVKTRYKKRVIWIDRNYKKQTRVFSRGNPNP